MKILIAEDNPTDRSILAAALEKLGHTVITTEHGREAWGVFQREEILLLISDWLMPHIDGLKLSRKIRAEHRIKYTYIILITAFGGKRNYLQGMEAGVDDFLTKPFDPDELAARLHVANRILSLQTEVRRLSGLLPICSYCKKIRNEDDQWFQIEHYIATRTDASFSHGICPECYSKITETELQRWQREAAKNR